MITTQFGTRCYEFWYADVPYLYHVLAAFVFIVSIFGFWPYFAGYHDTILEISALKTNVHSIENIVASTVLITLTVPLAIDGILDFTLSLFRDRNKAKETDILNYIERTFIYSGFLVFPICAFINQQYPDTVLLALCCSRFQYCMVYGGCFMSVTRIAPHCFPTRLCMLALGSFYVAHLTLTYAYVTMDSLEFYYAVSYVLLLFTFFIFLFMLMHWMWVNYMSPFLSRRTLSAITVNNNHSTSSAENSVVADDASSLKNDIKTRNNMFVSILTVVGVIGTVILFSVTGPFVDYTPANLALIHIAFSVFALGLLIYHLRKFRSDALLRLHALVNKKATLLKYVHELYEPISTIYKAQKHMIEELGEVSVSLFAAVFILCSFD